jgi:hypothetical protein
MIGSSGAEGKDLDVVSISNCSHSAYDAAGNLDEKPPPAREERIGHPRRGVRFRDVAGSCSQRLCLQRLFVAQWRRRFA